MKRIYITPVLQVVTISCTKLMAESLVVDPTKTTDTQYVKGNSGSTPTSSYNVWDDDWNK